MLVEVQKCYKNREEAGSCKKVSFPTVVEPLYYYMSILGSHANSIMLKEHLRYTGELRPGNEFRKLGGSQV